MIGTEEAIDALVAIANWTPESGGHEAACALAESKNPRAQHAAANWNRRNDGYEEVEGSEIEFSGRKMKVWKMDEVLRSNMRVTMKGCSEGLEREYAPMLSVWSGE